MPETPGDYELRYVQGTSGAILARRKVVVSTVTAGLEADAEVPSGRALAISWTGPANPGDYIAVADHSMVEGSRYLASNAITGDNPLILTMPDAPGEYELRYVQGQSHTILARQPTTVLSATASLEADAQIPSGRTLVVDWTGPNNQRDYISVAEASMPESGYLAYTYVENGNPLELNMPDAPGDYELRYVQGQSNTVLARRPVQVSPVSARVVANAQVPAGGTVNVAWQGPANLKDYLAIVDVGATDAVAYHSQVAATGNNELQLIAPDQPGDYTIAYVQGQSKTILARQPLEVTPVAASLDYAADPVVGKELAVSWTGPANNRDYISVALPGSDDAAYLAYQYTKTGNPIVLTLPAAPGKYELRYVQGQSHTAIARRAITVGLE
jgi:Ca-activated chloride channel family protein